MRDATNSESAINYSPPAPEAKSPEVEKYQSNLVARHESSIDKDAVDLALKAKVDADRVAERIEEAGVKKDLKHIQESNAQAESDDRRRAQSEGATQPIEVTKNKIKDRKPPKHEFPKKFKENVNEIPLIRSNEKRRAEYLKNRTTQQRIKDGVKSLAWNTRLAVAGILQFGALRPTWTESGFAWMVTPRADIKDDPHQPPYNAEKYQDLAETPQFAELKTIDFKAMGGQRPMIRPIGPGGLQYIDHRRIAGMKAMGKNVVVETGDFTRN